MRSDTVKKGFERAPHRSLLKGTGNYTDGDIDKPFIAICNSFVEIIPGHAHLDKNLLGLPWFPRKPGLSLVESISRAGGLTDNADLQGAVVLREGRVAEDGQYRGEGLRRRHRVRHERVWDSPCPPVDR